MRSSTWRFGRACVSIGTGAFPAIAAGVVVASTVVTASPLRAAEPAALIPALQIDGRGFGHGVGMAQDGALAMGQSGATLSQILAQFYPGTTLGKASGSVRVPVYAGNNVEIAFPDGGEVRGNAGTISFAPGTSALVSREGASTRVKPSAASAPPTTAAPTTTSSSTTTTSVAPTTTTTTALFPVNGRTGRAEPLDPLTTTTTSPSAPATTAPASPGLLYSGVVTADGVADGRVAVVPRSRRYRGVVEITPLAGTGGLRFVNELGVESYLRGMGEVRNPSWPGPSLQAQAVAARTYALRAMRAGGELCDTQRCQVYIGSDAEYAAMDKAVAGTSGQVLLYGKGLASAVYSANGGGYSATREEGFGLGGPDSYPYLRAAPYLCPKPDVWTLTVALRDVGRRLNYRGELTGAEVAQRGPSGRATRIVLHGSAGDVTVAGVTFDAALGLKSTLFSLRTTMATQVSTITGGSVLQAPPDQASALTTGRETTPTSAAATPRVRPVQATSGPSSSGVGAAALVAVTLWCFVVGRVVRTRQRARRAWHAHLS